MPEKENVEGELARIRAAWDEATNKRIKPVEEEIAKFTGELALVQQRLDGLLRQENRTSDVQPSGPYQGLTMAEMMICQSIADYEHQRRPDDASQAWVDSVKAALATTDWADAHDGSLSSELWRGVMAESKVAGLFRQIRMPTNPFSMPVSDARIRFLPGTQNAEATDDDIKVSNRTLTAVEAVGQVSWSYDLDEDSVIAMSPHIRENFEISAAETLDDLILNGDTDLTATNINKEGATVDRATLGEGHWTLLDGLRKGLLGEADRRYALALDGGNKESYRQLLEGLDDKAQDIRNLVFLVPPRMAIDALTIPEVVTIDKFGSNATIRTGQLAAIFGIPIVSTPMLRKNVAADGKVNSTPANNVVWSMIGVNTLGYRLGFRRELQVETERSVSKRQYTMTGSLRVAFQSRETNTANEYGYIGMNAT